MQLVVHYLSSKCILSAILIFASPVNGGQPLKEVDPNLEGFSIKRSKQEITKVHLPRLIRVFAVCMELA